MNALNLRRDDTTKTAFPPLWPNAVQEELSSARSTAKTCKRPAASPQLYPSWRIAWKTQSSARWKR